MNKMHVASIIFLITLSLLIIPQATTSSDLIFFNMFMKLMGFAFPSTQCNRAFDFHFQSLNHSQSGAVEYVIVILSVGLSLYDCPDIATPDELLNTV